jgi:hypothetical protein
MRKTDVTQHAMFSYRSLEERIPEAHPLRKLRILVDGILQSMSAEFEPLYSRRGRPSIAPEHAAPRIGDSTIKLVDDFPDWGSHGPKALKGSPVTLHRKSIGPP